MADRQARCKLMNSAMMPNLNGKYVSCSISFDEFCRCLKSFAESDVLDSYIGYPQNVDLIEKWTGVRVELNRDLTTLEVGDIMLVMRLKYRPDPSDKGKVVSEDDFVFSWARFEMHSPEDYVGPSGIRAEEYYGWATRK